MICIFILLCLASVLTHATPLLAEQRTRDQNVIVPQRWEGQCFQTNYPPYPLNIDIVEGIGNVFIGTYDATYGSRTQPKSLVKIKGGIMGEEIFFTSYERMRGKDVIPTYFYGKILDKNMIVNFIGGLNAEIKGLCNFHLAGTKQ